MFWYPLKNEVGHVAPLPRRTKKRRRRKDPNQRGGSQKGLLRGWALLCPGRVRRLGSYIPPLSCHVGCQIWNWLFWVSLHNFGFVRSHYLLPPCVILPPLISRFTVVKPPPLRAGVDACACIITIMWPYKETQISWKRDFLFMSVF